MDSSEPSMKEHTNVKKKIRESRFDCWSCWVKLCQVKLYSHHPVRRPKLHHFFRLIFIPFHESYVEDVMQDFYAIHT